MVFSGLNLKEGVTFPSLQVTVVPSGRFARQLGGCPGRPFCLEISGEQRDPGVLWARDNGYLAYITFICWLLL